MGKINKTAVCTQSWDKIFTVLNTISDPAGKTKWLYSAFPMELIDDKGSYPLIVIEPIDTAYSPKTFTNIKSGPLRVVLEVYSTKSQELDTVTDLVADKMEESETSFLASGISVMTQVSNSYGHYMRGKLRIHNKTMVYTFDYWWHQ